jgi:hypothetical protein
MLAITAFVNLAALFALCMQYQSINCLVSLLSAAVARVCEQMLIPHQFGQDFSHRNFPLVTKCGLLMLLELATILDPFGHPGATETLSGSLSKLDAFFQIPTAVSL